MRLATLLMSRQLQTTLLRQCCLNCCWGHSQCAPCPSPVPFSSTPLFRHLLLLLCGNFSRWHAMSVLNSAAVAASVSLNRQPWQPWLPWHWATLLIAPILITPSMWMSFSYDGSTVFWVLHNFVVLSIKCYVCFCTVYQHCKVCNLPSLSYFNALFKSHLANFSFSIDNNT